MSDYERLKNQLQPAPYLTVNGPTGEVKLVGEQDALRLMAEAGLFHSRLIMNARRALENFAMLAGKTDRPFSLKEVATITGTPYSQAYGWIDEKVIVPSIRPKSGAGRDHGPQFSLRDAFAAGICGSLRRQGVRLETLRNVSLLFSTKKKRTARKVATSARP